MKTVFLDRTKLAAWAGMVGPALFVGIFMLEGWLRPGYNPLSTYVSALSLGSRGWIQIANFIVLGILLLIFSFAVRSEFPAGKASRGGAWPGVSADGRFLYAGNRLHDSIAIFSIGAAGSLTYVGEEWTRGNYPRSFNFDPTGRFLYCCNQRGDNLAVFRVERQTGGLVFTGHYTPVGNPSIIVFLDLAKTD